MKDIIAFIRSEPVAIAAVVAAAISLAVAFGLSISPEQKAAILVFVGAVLTVITRNQVSPVPPAEAPPESGIK